MHLLDIPNQMILIECDALRNDILGYGVLACRSRWQLGWHGGNLGFQSNNTSGYTTFGVRGLSSAQRTLILCLNVALERAT
jgi:hypothetical protein